MTAASFPKDSEAQRIGRAAELAAAHAFETHGWTVPGPSTSNDFGVDFSAYKRSITGHLVPMSVAIQVKGIRKAFGPAPCSVNVKSSSLSLWLWSQTPTLLVVVDVNGVLKWETVASSLPRRSKSAQSRARRLAIGRSLSTSAGWEELEEVVRRQWSSPLGVGVLGDLPLAVHVLTELALYTDLWTASMDTDAVHEAAAVYVYRVASGLNALAGRVGQPDFLQLAEDVSLAETFGVAQVRRRGKTLGLVEFVTSQAWSEDLLGVFRACAHEIIEALPRLRSISRLPELGVPQHLQEFLEHVIDQTKLAVLVDPERAAHLRAEDLKQISSIDDNLHLGFVKRPSDPDVVNTAPRRRRLLTALDAQGITP